MLRQSWGQTSFQVGPLATTTPSFQPLATTLRSFCEAWRQALAAYRGYERLTSTGTCHDVALRLALGMSAVAGDAADAKPTVSPQCHSRAPSRCRRHGHHHPAHSSRREQNVVQIGLLSY